jgi:IS5 family transposase
VFGDAGYLGIQKRVEHKHRKNFSWFIAIARSWMRIS